MSRFDGFLGVSERFAHIAALKYSVISDFEVSRVHFIVLEAMSVDDTRWRYVPYSFLAWLETSLKGIAMLVSILLISVQVSQRSVAAGSRHLFSNKFLNAGPRLGQAIIHSILALGLCFAIYERIKFKAHLISTSS